MPPSTEPHQTRILSVKDINPPSIPSESDPLEWFEREKKKKKASGGSPLPADQVAHLLEAAHLLQTSSIPVAFPTETVYGLGADATRSEAVRGIFAAKGRPADNPLIVHVGSLGQLRRALLRGGMTTPTTTDDTATHPLLHGTDTDPIPSIYKPLIARFWPGPLTLLFPLPRTPSPSQPSSPFTFAPETHPNLQSVGIRMPASPLARLLIALADRPLAAPSANASTRPSPTTASHVWEDLHDRIDLILDGGPCHVGVESTVVDGFAADGGPPVVLRPGGVGIEEIRRVGGPWSRVRVGYGHVRTREVSGTVDRKSCLGDSNKTDRTSLLDDDDDESRKKVQSTTTATTTSTAPRAPGMKYRHYAPRARVILFEEEEEEGGENGNAGALTSSEDAARRKLAQLYPTHNDTTTTDTSTTNSPPPALPPPPKIGIIATKTWHPHLGLATHPPPTPPLHPNTTPQLQPHLQPHLQTTLHPQRNIQLISIPLGPSITSVARSLFGALRYLDAAGCELILVEGIATVVDVGKGNEEGEGEGDDRDGEEGEDWHLAAAVMDRLRKAAASAA